MRGKIPFFAVGSVLVLSVAGGGLAGTGRWETLLKTPWAQDFLKAYFSDPSRGWVLGQWGTLLRTVDGGSSWTQVLWRDSLGCEAMAGAPAWECYGPEVHGLAVIEDSLVWVVGVEHLSQGGDAKGFVLHSPDGGTTWRWQLSVPFRALRDVSFVNSVRGWAVGDSGTIVSTSDGGGVWVRQASGVSATLCAVCFADSLWGWVVGTDGTALHTTDGGVAWHPVTVPQATYVDVFFVDRLHGWLLESSRSVLRTIDGGNSWQEVRVTDLDFPLTSLFFIDSREGWVALGRLPGGLHGRQAPSLFATTDGGETWVPHVLPFAPAGNDVVFVGKEAGFLAGAEGTILRTTDGGQEWHPLMPVPARALRRVYFADHRHGWVTGDRLSLRTADGGATWQPCPYVPWLSMFSSDTLHGWALGDSVYYTADGGVTWVSLPPPVPGTPIAAFILNDSLGWISYLSPGQSLLARTSDRGRSWQINDSLPLEIRSLFFVDSCCGWAVGNRGLYADVCFTADGGVSWIEQYRGSAPYCSFEDVFFVDPVAGWAVGTARSIRTLDGGRSWEECGPFGPCVHFVTREEGWLAGYWTVDGGSTWQRLASSEEEARFFCSDLYFLDSAHGWAVGIGASIYRWVSGLNVPDKGLVRLLESFELAAYPNPCPGDMIIILTGGEGKPTALEIRNVSGRLVRRLVVPPGGTRSRAIPWDGRDERGAKCPAGVYLVGLDNDPARAKLKILLLH